VVDFFRQKGFLRKALAHFPDFCTFWGQQKPCAVDTNQTLRFFIPVLWHVTLLSRILLNI